MGTDPVPPRMGAQSSLYELPTARREGPQGNAVPEPGEFMIGRVVSTDGNYEESQEEWRVIAIMRQLPSEQRKVAALFYDGLPPEEIAEVIGKPAATVRS